MDKYRLIQEHMAGDDQHQHHQQQQPLAMAAATTSTTAHDRHHHPTATTTTGGVASSSSDSSSVYPEVRITHLGKPRNYISYAMNLFADGAPTVVLKAMGRAMNKAVTIAEILKRKMPLHQWNTLNSMEMIDVYEPIEEGLDVVESRRYVSCMTIMLSTQLPVVAQPPPLLQHSGVEAAAAPSGGSSSEVVVYDTDHAGYQPPLPESEMHPRDIHQHKHQHQRQQRHLVSTS